MILLEGSWTSLLSNRSGELRIKSSLNKETKIEFISKNEVVYTEEVYMDVNDEKQIYTFIPKSSTKHCFLCRINFDKLSGKYCGTFTSIYPLDQGIVTF